MPRHRTIELRFIRRSSLPIDAATDDILRITRIEENSNRVVYTEKSGAPVVDVMTFTNQQLLSYLYRVFWLTNLDEDPFSSMQLFVPGFPTCMLSVTALRQSIPTVMDCIASVFLNWPIIGTDRGEAVRQSCHALLTTAAIRGPEETSNGGGNGNGANGC
jgi:hypothetical protein